MICSTTNCMMYFTIKQPVTKFTLTIRNKLCIAVKLRSIIKASSLLLPTNNLVLRIVGQKTSKIMHNAF